MQRGGAIGDPVMVRRQTQSTTVDMLNLTSAVTCTHTVAPTAHVASNATIHDLSQHASNNLHLVTEDPWLWYAPWKKVQATSKDESLLVF